MENASQSKAKLTVNIMEHGTVVGTDEPVTLEFEDCGNAICGLVSWMADALATVNEVDAHEIGSAMLVDALHHWTFDEHVDEDEELGDEPEE